MADQEKERTDIKIEGSTAVWEMREDGDIQGTYIGTFRFKCFLTPLQQIAANREQRELLGLNQTMTPEHEVFLAYALTQLKYRIVTAPPFWSSASPDGSIHGDIPDENVISSVLDAAIGAEVKYKNQLKKRKLDSLERAKKIAETMIEEQDKKAEDDEEADEGEDQEGSDTP